MRRSVIKAPLLGLALLVAGLLAIPHASPAIAKQSSHAEVPAPPDPVYEVDPGERPGYTWTPGYWRWDGAQHTWISGHWIEDRPGYVWMPYGWEHRGHTWRFVKGHWEEDADSQTASKIRKQRRHHARHPDYRNPKLWPRVAQH